MVITQTPFRMSFFGGGTDFEGFYKEHGGVLFRQPLTNTVLSRSVIFRVFLNIPIR